MKKMERLFGDHPPLKPIDSLDALVDDWEYRFGANGLSKHMRDEVVSHCIHAGNLDEAINRACASLRPNGKLHNHQSRVPKAIRDKYASIIKRKFDTVTINNFDELHDWLDEIKPNGIGPVTLYDVATRIGGFLNMEPTSLYLHAGVREGWNILHGTRRSPEVNGRVPREMLPAALQRIPADQVEDMVCAYREVLQPWLKGTTDTTAPRHNGKQPKVRLPKERSDPRAIPAAQTVKEMQPHHYFPSMIHQGDCGICGHMQDSALHIDTPKWLAENELKPHKVMTRDEYMATKIIGWHMVCFDIDGFDGVGIRYLGEHP